MFTIALRNIYCLDETGEWGSDEPYVLVTSVNLRSLAPQVEVVKYGPFGDVDRREARTTVPYSHKLPQNVKDMLKRYVVARVPFWGLNERPANIADLDDVVFVAAMMENDDGNSDAKRSVVKTAATASIAASNGMSRAARVGKLITDIDGALDVPTGAPNFDDQIGRPQEIRLRPSDLARATSRGHRRRYLWFTGAGGRYRAGFEIKHEAA